MYHLSLLLCLIALGALLPTSTHAQPRQLDYYVLEQPARDMIEELGRAAQVPVVVDPGVTLTVRSWGVSGTFAEAMRRVEAELGLFVYSDGTTYHVFPGNARETRVVQTGSLPEPRVARALDAVLPHRPAQAVEVKEDLGAVILRGPPDFLDAAEASLRHLGLADRDIEVIKFGIRSSTSPTPGLKASGK